MASKTRTPELIFNLQWNRGFKAASDSKNLIGIFDTTLTTLNLNSFKSYLLKNSGITANDIDVTYVTDDNKDWLIETEKDFELALNSFRLKSKLNEVILLKLEENDGSRKIRRRVIPHSTISSIEQPPEWFINYMANFKTEVASEILQTINIHLDESKLKCCKQQKEVIPESEKPKSVLVKKKKARKCLYSHNDEQLDKELLRTLKYDRKLEIKLDKLDAKTKKYKQKKESLVLNQILDAGLASEVPCNNHITGDQFYTHTWKIINKGQVPFNDETELRWAWGSAELKPLFRNLKLPSLLPNQKGFVQVSFFVPKTPGKYESYWNFYQGDVRFGTCLSCIIIVDPVPKAETFKIRNVNTPLEHFNDDQIYKKCNYCEPLKIEKSKCDLIYNSTTCNTAAAAAAADDDEDDGQTFPSKLSTLKLDDTGIDKDINEKEFIDFENVTSYGISEEELIVDLSFKDNKNDIIVENQTDQVKVENLEKNIDNQPLIQNEDDNNNNGDSINNNSTASASRAASVSSDSNSSYDLIDAKFETVQEDEHDFIMVVLNDGENKVKLPKSWINPDLLKKHEKKLDNIEANIPTNEITMDNASGGGACYTSPIPPPITAPFVINEQQSNENDNLLQNNDDLLKSFVSHCSTAGTCFSDINNHEAFVSIEKGPIDYTTEKVNLPSTPPPSSTSLLNRSCILDKSIPSNQMYSSRLFIFPQNNPGYEVVEPTVVKPEENDQSENVYCPTNKVEVLPTELQQTYTWARSQTQYTLADVQNGGHLRFDPYGPLETSRPTTSTTVFESVPNYQQTPRSSPPKQPEQSQESQQQQQQRQQRQQASPTAPPQQTSTPTSSPKNQQVPQQPNSGFDANQHYVDLGMFPENIVNGAVNVASSAINTARSVINMIVPKSEPGRWVNGHWVTDQPESLRAKHLRTLAAMGFWNYDLNATLLARYNDDIMLVIDNLLTM